LKRKLAAFNLKNLFQSGQSDKKKSSFLHSFYRSIKNLEKKYQDKIKEIEPQEENEVGKQKSVLLQEANTLVGQKKFKEAEEKYIDALSLDNRCFEAYTGLAELYVENKDFTHAKEIYEYLLKIHTPAGATTRKGDDNTREERKDFAQSTTLNSQVAGYQADLGEVYLAMDYHQKALDCFKEAIKLEPNNPRHLDLVIETTIVLKDKKLAEKYYTKLKGVNPENEKLKDFKEKISKL